MLFSSRYFYMALGAVSLMLGFAMLLNASTPTFAKITGQNTPAVDSYIFLLAGPNSDNEIAAASNSDNSAGSANPSVNNSPDLPSFEPFDRRVDEFNQTIDSLGRLLDSFGNLIYREVMTDKTPPQDFPTALSYTEEEIAELEKSIRDAGAQYSSRPATVDKTLNIMGRYLSVPDNFYFTVHFIDAVCGPPPTGLEARPCSETPSYVLADFESDAMIRVSGGNGKIFLIEGRTPRQEEEDIQKFAWLIEQLESLGIMQPIVIPPR